MDNPLQFEVITLDPDKYYARESDLAYMSCSQYQDFLDCEARAMAKLEGRFEREESEAFLVGNYFHSYFESPEAHEEFCEKHFDKIFKYTIDKKTGEPIIKGKYAPYEKADKLIKAIESDELCQAFIAMPGENEKVVTGTIFGVPWKARYDKYITDGRIILDYKTCKSIYETSYNPTLKQRETFVETYGYMMRAAVYTELEKQFSGEETDPEFILMCVSKEDPPDKELVSLKHRQRYDYELEQIKEHLPRIMLVKQGIVAPRKCGVCEYCRSVKKLSDIKPYYKLMPEYRGEREEDEQADFFQVQKETTL